ncbi:MAG: PDZ domain-containing protein [Chloroflexi bacterium]|nr:PDZ domain-containing protein [Chloroflexota bacterium]
MGYAIPVNAVKRIAPALIADGVYVYPFLGVSVYDGLDLAAQEALGLPQATGAYVTTVTADGPAGLAGVRGSGGNNLAGGDLIVGIDDEVVNSFSDLISYLVFETEVGQTVTLTILRDGEEIELPVELGARP